MGILVLGTMVAVVTLLTLLLGADGLSVVDVLMVGAIALTLPWTVLGFWNAVIGFAILRSARDPLRLLAPLRGLDDIGAASTSKTAIVVPVYNEDPDLVRRHLEATIEDLARAGSLDGFEVFLLSDSNRPDIVVDEDRVAANLRRHPQLRGRFHFRRRLRNDGYKTGNLWSFLDVHGGAFDYLLVLDADSLMSGAAIHRLVRVMDANPRLGILQTLITGLPTQSAFTRLFQFGMRHAMRSYTTGSAWWQGPAGPYWGHNGLIRLAPFRAHCRLEPLAGRPPWGGLVLSHDLVEAVRMQRAGYEVRVLADEFGSHELNPPTLPEFVRRSLRWCQGNLQYIGLLRREAWHPMGRLHLILAILMYLSGPAWLLFVVLGFVQGVLGVGGFLLIDAPLATLPAWVGWSLLATMITMVFAPKIAGVADALCDRARRQDYGGPFALVAAALVEMLYGMVVAPIMAFSESFFIGRLLTGRGLAWGAQERGDHVVTLRDAARRFWPQTLAGATFLAAFIIAAPGLVFWVVPVALGPLLAIPFAWASSQPALGRALVAWRVAAIPEESNPSPVVLRALPWLKSAPNSTAVPLAAAHPAPAATGGGD